MSKVVVYWATFIAKEVLRRTKTNVPVALSYAKVELVPPKITELGEVKRGFGSLISAAKSGKWKTLTVKEAWLNTLVGIEIAGWFYIGEVIGRRNMIGYDIKY